ncbi:MAG: hypothetical protein VW397_01150, partial [Candidatus Margulisiibacteriota bacterium]
YQPWYFLGAIKLSKFNLENAASMAGIPTNEVVFILTVLLIGVMMATAMIFFAPLYFAKNENNSMQLLSTIRQSFRLFYQFKWITIMFIIYFFLTFMIFKILVLQMVVFIAPNYLHDLFFHMFNAVERTVFYIFILRFYFYLRPLVNLSYN